MTIVELMTSLNVDLRFSVKQHGDNAGAILCSLDRCEVRGTKEALLSGEYGGGATIGQAARDYCTKVAGRTIVRDADLDSRLIVRIPSELKAQIEA